DMFDEFASFMHHTPWYMFPFDEFIELFEQVYNRHREFALEKSVNDVKSFKKYDQMDSQLLMANRYLFKVLQIAANLVKKSLSDETLDPYTHFVVSQSTSQTEMPEGIAEEVARHQSGLKLLRAERYEPLTKAVLESVSSGHTVEEVAGNKFVSVRYVAPKKDIAKIPDVEEIQTYQFPTASFEKADQGVIHSIRIPVSRLGDFLKMSEEQGWTGVRVHDF
ncbi:MAG: hypothetical protein AAF202_14135, partial [Pseudomonadota bacterium]